MSIKDVVEFPKLGLEITLDKVAFSIGGLHIYWYGIIITAGILIAAAYGLSQTKKYGLDPNRVIDTVMGGLIGAYVGARLYFVLFSLSEYDSFIDVINVRDGGLAIYGGIIGAVIVGGIISRIRKLKFPPMLDIAGLGFLIGQSIGRWGNFVNREAFGKNTDLPWGMTSKDIQYYLTQNKSTIAADNDIIVDPFKAVHPTFLYESIWCAIGFIILHFYSKKRKFDGEVFLMYIAWYGAGRFFIEGLRTDSLMLGKIRVSQLLAGISVIASIALIFFIRSRIKRAGEYVFYKDTEESKLFLEQFEQGKKKDAKKIQDSENDENYDDEIDNDNDESDEEDDSDDVYLDEDDEEDADV
ncbi:MAG: prolipoprotein diacylglyceryl transferase [Clostridiales bacterium]|nr:prolipoprotein diacylglyceryl transferase [Clostridiales bacterium]